MGYIRYLLFLALCTGLLTACGQAPAAGPVTFMVFGDAAEKAAYEELVAAFEQTTPQADVQLIHIPGQSDYRKRLGIDFAAGTPADVVLINYRRYAPFAAKSALEPLGPYLEHSSLINEQDFYPEAIAPFKWQGTLMCIPQNLSSLVVYYNRDLFAAAGLPEPAEGWTWADFVQAAVALTRDNNGDGQIDQYGVGVEPSIFRVAPFIWQNGGELVDDPAHPTRMALDEPAAREALAWFVELQLRHHATPDRAAEQAAPSEQRFLNGQLGMFLNSRRGVPTYRTIESFNWDVAPLPRGQTPAGILHADAYCLPALSKQKEAAWRFIEFANSPAGQRIIARSGRTVPSLRSVAESPDFLEVGLPPVHSQVFLDVIPAIRTVPIMEGWVDIEDLAGEELARAFYGEASLDEVIRRINERSVPFFRQ